MLGAFALSFVLCWIIIPILRRMGAGQNILSYVKEHKSKSGTPTFGGLAFLPAAILAALLFTPQKTHAFFLTISVGAAYTVVGFLDDFIKKKRKENLGLTAAQKLIFQTCIALLSAVYCYRNGFTFLYLPFLGSRVDLGWGIFPFSVFVFLASVNAVNLTDGLDGLAAGVSAPFFFFLGCILFVTASLSGLSELCFCLTGALGAYLVFNAPKASVFMGDTGSLGLGGLVASVCLFSGNALYLPIIGFAFVASAASVILQVAYFKATGGKRIFKMAPVHHHFQELGFSESKISYAYFIITAILGVICLVTIL